MFPGWLSLSLNDCYAKPVLKVPVVQHTHKAGVLSVFCKVQYVCLCALMSVCVCVVRLFSKLWEGVEAASHWHTVVRSSPEHSAVSQEKTEGCQLSQLVTVDDRLHHHYLFVTQEKTERMKRPVRSGLPGERWNQQGTILVRCVSVCVREKRERDRERGGECA